MMRDRRRGFLFSYNFQRPDRGQSGSGCLGVVSHDGTFPSEKTIKQKIDEPIVVITNIYEFKNMRDYEAFHTDDDD